MTKENIQKLTDEEIRKLPVKERMEIKVKCKNCEKEMPYCDKYGRKKTFCTVSCAYKWVGKENEIYLEPYVENLLQELMDILEDNADILFEKELYVLHSKFTDDHFSHWGKKFADNANIMGAIKKIKKITELRQLKAGAFENVMVDAYTVDNRPMRGPDGQVLKDENGIVKYEPVERSVKISKSVNPGFLKFVLANHHGYKTTVSDNNNKNLNSDGNDLQDVIDATWEANNQKKEKSNF